MPHPLETAPDPNGLSRVVIEPLSRVEGHGKVTLLLDEHRRVHQARLHIVEFRGFERFIQGRPYWEVPTLVQRLCGICPVSHLLAASKACDAFVVGHSHITPTATLLRRLLHFAQILQSNALHFFHLASPDLLFGFDDAVSHRNIVGVLQDQRQLGLQGVKIRKYGQEVIRMLTGKRIHGTGSVPGGFNRPLSVADRDTMLADIAQITQWCDDTMRLAQDLFMAGQPEHGDFANFPSKFLSLVRPDGAADYYDGALRVQDESGQILHDQVDANSYASLIAEEVKPWTYMKFPHLRALGPEQGWYRVGPLARINNATYLDTPRAEAARQAFKAWGGTRPVSASLAQHWARMIDTLHCAESIERLLHHPDILGTDLMASGTPLREGIGVIEAPRGTLIHHYRINDDDLITHANLIVATTHNNTAMNEAVRDVAARYFDGRELTEGLLNRIEVAVRAYDPCLSCATHAVGKMPLWLELQDHLGHVQDVLLRHEDGALAHEAPPLAPQGLSKPIAPLLVLAAGNPSRGDDAVGPLLAQRLTDWLRDAPAQLARQVEVIADQQLVIEQVDDLRGRHRVLFIDASATQSGTSVPASAAMPPMPPWKLMAVAPQARQPMASHQCTPEQLLAWYVQLYQHPAPPTDLLTLAGHDFELGASLSAPVRTSLDAAWQAILHWLDTHA